MTPGALKRRNVLQLSMSCVMAFLTVVLHLCGHAIADPIDEAATRLARAYPDFVIGRDGRDLLFKDGTRLPLDDGIPDKSHTVWLDRPDLEDIFRYPYPAAGAPAVAPERNADPGRARPAAFFAKMYGDCRRDEVRKNLVTIDWLPRTAPAKLQVTRINGVAERLEAVSRALDDLGPAFTKYLSPSAGTYNCRPVAGTTNPSAHGFGIAIDIAVAPSHYWRWQKPLAASGPVWRNAIPLEIVAIFEQHGFVWGGRWHHYDTMHFEYRPELARPTRP
ncbi:MAG TPA: M15 family metallopeptidase [Hyphomicrobiaceae bacterium]|nr:M15 family metallopeptidase [Hyphomicrobiaceae bacterium]